MIEAPSSQISSGRRPVSVANSTAVRIPGEVSSSRCAELPHDFRCQVPVGFCRFGFGRHVSLPNDEVLAQSGGDGAGSGQPHGADAGEHGTNLAAARIRASSLIFPTDSR